MDTLGLNLPDLLVGARGPAVLAVHRQLARDGFYSSSIDGNFGPLTEKAVRAFQRSHNVPDDGVVGPATWAAFGDAGLDLSALATPPPDGDETPATSGATESLASAGVAEAMAASGDAEVLASSRDDGVPGMSTSLRHTAGRVGTDEISAYEVVAELLKTHPEYADGRARSFDVGAAPPGAQRLGFGEWLARVRPLFDPTLLADLTTRTVVWGLALLDRQLLTRLERDAFLEAFRAHRTEEILSPEGLALLERADARPGTAVTSDAWTWRDDLESELYADAIATFIRDGRTRAPLTIGIKAPWGGGKTSLMKMIQRRLDPAADPGSQKARTPAPARPARSAESHLKVIKFLRDTWGRTQEQAAAQLEPDHPIRPGQPADGAPRITVWFNAWKYQSSEQLWAGLAHAIVSQLERRMSPLQRERFWASLQVRRIHPGALRRSIYRALVARLLPWALTIVVGGVIAAAGAVIPGAAVGGLAAAGAIARGLGFLREDVAAISPALVSDPGYEGKLGFLHLVDADMKRILALANATPEHPLVVFVDDLDRCSYGTVAQVIEALNVFLAGDFENCIFVIGMEPDLVAAQIHVAYERLFDRLGKPRSGDLGWRFLEKMVQLPVALPPPSRTGVDRYLDSILGAGLGARVTVEAADLGDDAPELQEAEKLFSDEAVSTAAGVRPALDRVRERAAQAAPLTPRQEAAIRRVGRQEFAHHLTEQDPAVRRMLRLLIDELPPNPREIKRFINVYRFYAFIQYEREAAGLPAPTLEGVAKLALLAVRYPHLLSALGEDVDQEEEGTDRCLLSVLETAENEADWAEKAKLAPAHVRPEVEAAALRELVLRQPVVGTFAAGFL
jgi:peptidoglycan hydrolase-like protein with peptidoglycan-binding domain